MSTLALPMPISTSSDISRPSPAMASASKPPGSARRPAPGLKTSPNMTLKASPSPDLVELDDDDEGDDDEDDDAGKKKRSGAPRKKTGAEPKGDYKYINEISQMMFVFGEVQDPLPETVKLVEDIVRGQIIEIVTRARLLTHLRSSRFLSAEDLIFLIRDDRGKVNRLRTYLSWKDVRKKAKEDEEGDVDVEDADKAKSRKGMVKLPWELLTPFGDFLRTLPSRSGRADEDEDEDEDELQAYQDSMQRLREADEITKKMTKDEYVHYSDCRQASFTYRKARRFRDFVNFGAYLDLRPNDDIVDILGFLSFEMVRSLCVTALEVRTRCEKAAAAAPAPSHSTGPNRAGRKTTISHHNPTERPIASPALKRRLTLNGESPSKKFKGDLTASPEAGTVAPTPATTGHGSTSGDAHPRKQVSTTRKPVSLFAPPPSARSPLLPSHVLEAFAQIQRQQAANRVGGLKNWRGGVGKSRMALV